MRKAPSFQFYPADYLTDFRLAGFSLAQHGAYFLLLSYDWLNDGLPDCTKSLARLLRADVDADILDVLTLFSQHPTKPNTITNSRLQAERENQKLYKEAQSANGKASAAKRSQVKFETVSKSDVVIEHQPQNQTHTGSRNGHTSPTTTQTPAVVAPLPSYDRQTSTAQTSKVTATQSGVSRSTLTDRATVERALTAIGLPLGRVQTLIALAIERGEDLATLLPDYQQPTPRPVDVAEPVEVKAKKKKSKEISIPKYQGPDREGNPRELVPGTRHIWLSGPEMAEIRAEFDRVGLAKEGRKLAVSVVDSWFEENKAQHAKSSEHITRIMNWGVKAALEKSTTEQRANRAKNPNDVETRGEREQRKAHELIAKLAEEDRQNELKRNGGSTGIGAGYLAITAGVE